MLPTGHISSLLPWRPLSVGANEADTRRQTRWRGKACSLLISVRYVNKLGTLTAEQIGNATGIFNLMRNIGGSFGIAAVTTMLARGAQVHQAAMVHHLTPYDPAFQQRLHEMTSALAVRGNPMMAPQQAYGAIYQALVGQGTLLAYIDNFRLLAFLCLLCIPAALLFKRVKAGRQAPAMH
jgi:DHA2 family multidrug resistance protein